MAGHAKRANIQPRKGRLDAARSKLAKKIAVASRIPDTRGNLAVSEPAGPE